MRATTVPQSVWLTLQDPYANFVIQTALSVTSGQLHANLVEAIRPYLPSLRGTPFGKASRHSLLPMVLIFILDNQWLESVSRLETRRQGPNY